MTIHSFEPIIGKNPKTLILGTMPGIASLEAGEYYAYPRNKFWQIMEQIFALPSGKYEDRITALQKHPIALWDVLHSCTRKGSLDSAIRKEKPNTLAEFLETHTTIQTIAFNGQHAAKQFKQHIITPRAINMITLPSTSSAYAGMCFEEKLRIWDDALSSLRA